MGLAIVNQLWITSARAIQGCCNGRGEYWIGVTEDMWSKYHFQLSRLEEYLQKHYTKTVPAACPKSLLLVQRGYIKKVDQSLHILQF
ncbi:hypothetical protein BH10CYA1_BH10CYA1_03730 [soil metagenome]